MHSLTKYMNGHSDVIMGAAMTNNDEVHTRLRFLQNGIIALRFLKEFLGSSSAKLKVLK